MNIEIHNSPWRYAVTDNLINSKVIETIQNVLADHDHQNHYYPDHSIWGKHGSIIEQTGKDILNNFDYWSSLFPNYQKYSEYEILTYASRQLPGHEYPIHDEHPKKAISFVTYIYPDSGQGTSLYKQQASDQLFYTIPWKIGRTFIFAGEPNITWHSYQSGNSVRITLNHFIIEKGTTKTFKPDQPGY